MITNEKFYQEWKDSGIETITANEVSYAFNINIVAATAMLRQLVNEGKAEISKCKNGKTNQYTIVMDSVFVAGFEQCK